MSITNYSTREVQFKIVLCGPPFAGKTTALRHLHANLDAASVSEISTVTNGEDTTVSFDFVPRDTMLLDGFSIRTRVFTVPGKVTNDLYRKRVLRDTDGIMFVADSDLERQEENLQSVKTIEEHLKKLGNPLDELPVVLLYNKRDIASAAPFQYLDFVLNNRKNRAPTFGASANDGTNIFDALRALANILVHRFISAEPANSFPSHEAGAAAD